MLYALKKIVPDAWIRAYHYVLAKVAPILYGFPSKRLIVIGVTGTNGKTTTAYLIAKALEASGYPTGCVTTAVIKIGTHEELNPFKMTMPGRWTLQRLMRQMVRAGCRYAVIETSSQGLIQFRHIGIAYDAAVFTNLTPEHIEAHGGFEAYQAAKRLLFSHVATSSKKYVDGHEVPKVAFVNAESTFASYYASTPGLPRVVWFGVGTSADVQAQHVQMDQFGSRFDVEGVSMRIQLPGAYNVENAVAALAVAHAFGISWIDAGAALANVATVSGRFTRIQLGQPWTVIIDYAPEPASLQKLYEALSLIPYKRLIHVLGRCGGGRDRLSRPVMGLLAAQHANIVIVTNEDPYDDDPLEIIHEVAAGAIQGGKIPNTNVFLIEDRREAIIHAINMAEPGDAVLITGKGSETQMCLAHGKKIPWNDQAVAEEAIVARQGAA